MDERATAAWAEQLVANLRAKRGGAVTTADVERMAELYEGLGHELRKVAAGVAHDDRRAEGR